MPELPDITVYIEALERRIVGATLLVAQVKNPFLVRTFDPPLAAAHGKHVQGLRRLGKRIAIGLEEDLWLVMHLMIAGRLHWKAPGAKATGKNVLAAFHFDCGTLTFTEAGAKRRASLHVVRGEAALAAHDPGGLDVFAASDVQFASALRKANHTLKRALTDPHIFSGIGNAYSDEILHHARLSPLLLTQKLSDEECQRLHDSVKSVLSLWIERLRNETSKEFPEGVTAFRPEMAVHGRYGLPCPDCGSPVQRIRYADNETNYCARCQNGGRILADRSLSRLLKDDWPRSLDEL